MKIVHVEDFFHPDAGYQVNLLSRLQRVDGHQVTVVTSELEKFPPLLTSFFGKDSLPAKDKAFEDETGVKVVRFPLLGYYSGRSIPRPSIFRMVKDERPDVVFVHGEDTLTGILFIWLSALLSYPIILDCHMLEMASQNPLRNVFRRFYRRFVTPVILKNNIPLIRVVDSNYVEKCLGIPLSHTDLLSFGTDTSYFKPDAERGIEVRSRLGFDPEAFVVLYAGKMDESKGGLFLAQSVRDRFTGGKRPIQLLVIGNTDGDYGERVEETFRRSENRLVRLPTQRYLDLAQYYQAADLAVFPKQCSLSFFEAQACGLPVLFEDNEVNAQRIQGQNGFTFRPSDVVDFRSQIVRLASIEPIAFAGLREQARAFVLKEYDYVPIAKKFTQVLERAVVQWSTKVAL